jgi:hypothetical protein
LIRLATGAESEAVQVAVIKEMLIVALVEQRSQRDVWRKRAVGRAVPSCATTF